MNSYKRLIAFAIALGFLVSLLSACSIFNQIEKQIKEKGETFTVKKDDIGDTMKSKKYGKFKLKKDHVKEVKKLKNGKQALFYDVSAKKSSKKKYKIVVLVVRVSSSKFQVSVMEQPSGIPGL